MSNVRLLQSNTELVARVAELEERLEITHCWQVDYAANELVRVEIPPEERKTFPDGITARDSTIDLLEKELTKKDAKLSSLRSENEKLREALAPFSAWAENMEKEFPAIDDSQLARWTDRMIHLSGARAALKKAEGEKT